MYYINVLAIHLWKRFRLSSRGRWIEFWKIFPDLDLWKIVFAIWKTLMNLGAEDIGCSKEINWFKAWMNQFVIKTDISTQQILNHTELQFHSSTLSKSSLHSFNNKIHSEQNHTKIKLWMRAKRNRITKY